MIWLFRDANYPFMDYRRWAYALSGLLVLATGVSILAPRMSVPIA